MDRILPAMDGAATALQKIADASAGDRRERAITAALVLRAVERRLLDGHGCTFLAARAGVEVARLPRGGERSALRGMLKDVDGGDSTGVLVERLVDYACALESTKRMPEAEAVLAVATAAAPDDPAVLLHAGRIARKAGDRERALALYARAREVDVERGALSRLAAVGEAVVSVDPERELSRAIRAAIREGDPEAAAVALEERARVRRSAGRLRSAARDLCVAASRFPDPTERARVAHELADVAVVLGDPLAAREALRLAMTCGSAAQRDHALGRLHALSRVLGDELGARRWRASKRPTLVSLSLSRPRQTAATAAPVLARWREALQSAPAPA